jgi:hypothetical protein
MRIVEFENGGSRLHKKKLVPIYQTSRRDTPEDSNLIRALFVTCFKLVSCLAYSSTLKKEAIYSSETSVEFNGLHGVIYVSEVEVVSSISYRRS